MFVTVVYNCYLVEILQIKTYVKTKVMNVNGSTIVEWR